jgi:transposase-like protein
MPKGTPFSGEFKQRVVEDVIKNKLGYNEAMRKYEISGDVTIQKWERIYLEEGPEGLYVERRGRACAAGGTRKGRAPKLEKKVEEDLIAEVQRLRAENDYLKKLNALVSERVQREKKHKS